jgi:hypothetical protein
MTNKLSPSKIDTLAIAEMMSCESKSLQSKEDHQTLVGSMLKTFPAPFGETGETTTTF